MTSPVTGFMAGACSWRANVQTGWQIERALLLLLFCIDKEGPGKQRCLSISCLPQSWPAREAVMHC